jgi:hypothetical protein
MKKIIIIIQIGIISITVSIAQTYQNTTIYTPKGTAVAALTLISGEYTNQQKLDLKNYWLSYYNDRITFVDEATRTYNCHAYAWHVKEGGNKVWINTPEHNKFWNDNSYVLTTSALGTKVSFASANHSAITTNQYGILESKWGPSPVFRHSIDDCPYNSSNLDYFFRTPPCTSPIINFTNQTVSSNTTVTGCEINVQNVTVTNNKKLILDAIECTTITGPFGVQLGSELEVKFHNPMPIIKKEY